KIGAASPGISTFKAVGGGHETNFDHGSAPRRTRTDAARGLWLREPRYIAARSTAEAIKLDRSSSASLGSKNMNANELTIQAICFAFFLRWGSNFLSKNSISFASCAAARQIAVGSWLSSRRTA